MKNLIFTFLFAAASLIGMNAQDVVRIELDQLDLENVTKTQAPDNSEALEFTNSVGWSDWGIVNFRSVTLGEYVTFRFKVYQGSTNARLYFKMFDGETDLLNQWAEPYPLSEGDWSTVEMTLLKPNFDGSQSRIQANLDFITLNIAQEWNMDAFDATKFYIKDIELVKGDDLPASGMKEPVANYKAYVNTKYVRINGKDDDTVYDDLYDDENAYFNKFTVNEEQKNLAGLPSGTSAFFWDKNYLYVYLNLTNDTDIKDNTATGAASWMGDGFQISLDAWSRYKDAAEALPGQVIGAGFLLGATGQEDNASTFAEYNSLVRCGSVKGSSNWTMETAIPWGAIVSSAVGKSGSPLQSSSEIPAWVANNIKAGFKFGIQVALNDRRGDSRFCNLFMGTDKDPHGYSGRWASCELVGTATPFDDPLYEDPNKGGGSGIDAKEVSNLSVYQILSSLVVDGENLAKINIYSIAGLKLVSANAVSGVNTIDMSNLSAGIYIVQVIDQSGAVKAVKIVK